MLLNRIEAMGVNSPIWRGYLRYEARQLIAMGGRTPGGRAAEIGCGSGYGTVLIMNQFGAASVDAVDLDPKMIARARRRLADYTNNVALAQGDATDLRGALDPVGRGQDASYEAVFDFAAVHHIWNWRDAVEEVARVLVPGGRFYFLEVTAKALARPSYRLLFEHPDKDRFTTGAFLAELTRHGLHIGDRWRTRMGGDYILGVAHRSGDPSDRR